MSGLSLQDDCLVYRRTRWMLCPECLVLDCMHVCTHACINAHLHACAKGLEPTTAVLPACHTPPAPHVSPGKKPQRYDYIVPPSYARLVNFTERLWDYDSCPEAQLKIWLARHLLASECSGGAGEAEGTTSLCQSSATWHTAACFVPIWCSKAARICSIG